MVSLWDVTDDEDSAEEDVRPTHKTSSIFQCKFAASNRKRKAKDIVSLVGNQGSNPLPEDAGVVEVGDDDEDIKAPHNADTVAAPSHKQSPHGKRRRSVDAATEEAPAEDAPEALMLSRISRAFDVEEVDLDDEDDDVPTDTASPAPARFTSKAVATDVAAEEEDAFDIEKELESMAAQNQASTFGTANNEEDEAPAASDTITLKVQCKKEKVQIRIGKAEAFGEAFMPKLSKYAVEHGWMKAGQSFKLQMDGDDVGADDTPETYDLEGEEVLDMIVL